MTWFPILLLPSLRSTPPPEQTEEDVLYDKLAKRRQLASDYLQGDGAEDVDGIKTEADALSHREGLLEQVVHAQPSTGEPLGQEVEPTQQNAVATEAL